MSGAAAYLASVARVIPGHSIDFYLGELPYAQGLQLQTIDAARQGVKFQQEQDADFEEVAGF